MIPLSGRAACTVTCPLELPSPDKLQGATIALKCQKYLEQTSSHGTVGPGRLVQVKTEGAPYAGSRA